MSIIQKIKIKLEQAFNPITCEVIDNSPAHAGHMDIKQQEPSHINILIVAPCFEKFSIIERHKQIYETLKEEIIQVHAISIDAKAPSTS